MKLVDANVLLYAGNQDAPSHLTAKSWLDNSLRGVETILFPWISLDAFVRVSMNPNVFPFPLTLDQAFDLVDHWLGAPAAKVAHEAPGHASLVRKMMRTAGGGASLVNDAHLAALAVTHGAQVVSFDRDFDRFAEVQRYEPVWIDGTA